MTINVGEQNNIRAQTCELTEDEEDAQSEEHHGKAQTPDPQALVICRGWRTEREDRDLGGDRNDAPWPPRGGWNGRVDSP